MAGGAVAARGVSDHAIQRIAGFFNEVEMATVHVMSELFERSENKDRLINKSGMVQELRAETSPSEDFETILLAWPQLVQLTRSLLDAPTEVRKVAMPLRELSLRSSSVANTRADALLAP